MDSESCKTNKSLADLEPIQITESISNTVTTAETGNYVTILHRLINLRNENADDLDNTKYHALFSYDKDHDSDECYTWMSYVNRGLGFAKFILSHFESSTSTSTSKRGNVAIHSTNCPQWFIASIGAMFAKKYFCGIYNTNNTEQCLHVIKTGECDIVVVESYSLLVEKYSTAVAQFSDQIQFIVINNDRSIVNLKNSNALDVFINDKIKIIDWDSLELSTYVKDAEFEKIVDTVSPDDVCTLIFTSGTIKNPKAVQITHRNICTAVEGVLDRIDTTQFEERFVSYLPLSHIAGLAMDLFAPIYCKSQVHFARPDAMRGSLKNTLTLVRPTVFFGVPRVWEKFREALAKVSEETYSNGWSGYALGSIMGAVKRVERHYNTTESSMYSAALYPFASVSGRVANKIKQKLGLDQCRHFATGAAPISKDVLEYFSSIGICIFELYGMSETCGVITVSDHVHSVKGSCGRPIFGVSVVIGANDEILVKGGNIFKGYHNSSDPNDIDEDGYLHTGDCGKIDKNGYLYITGRIKELLITAGGENIPPVKIEDNIKSELNLDVQIMLIGDKKKFLTMLVFGDILKSNDTDQNAKVIDDIRSAMKKYNTNHAISNSQKIQDFRIVNEPLTIENGMLTPTMKMKRSKIVEKYSDRIEAMYSEAATI